MELMQATLSGSGDKIIRLLHTLYRNNLKRSRDLKAFRVAEAQLREVLGCIYSISRRPMDSAPAQEPALWSIEDAMARQIHAFRRAIPLQSKESGSLSPLVLRTLELLTQRHDQTVYVGAIAAELGVTDSHLSRSFKQQLGIGIAEYIRYVRVYAAAAELCTGDARIRDVAEHHGFSDSKYFSKVFHQVLGLTPSQWLQRHAQSGAAQEVLAGKVPISSKSEKSSSTNTAPSRSSLRRNRRLSVCVVRLSMPMITVPLPVISAASTTVSAFCMNFPVRSLRSAHRPQHRDSPSATM